MRTTSNREACTGVTVDGTYQLVIEGNTIRVLSRSAPDRHTQAILRDNVIDGNPRLGVLIGGNAIVSLSTNTIINNGRTPGTEPAGGVVVSGNGQADLGGGTLTIGGQPVASPGRNRLQGNGVTDVRNLRSGYTVQAEANCWDHATVELVSINDLIGLVDVDPLGSVCGPIDGQPPAAPTGLRIIAAP